MGAKIKTSCPDCGDVEVSPGDVRAVVCNIAEWSWYGFNCPACHAIVRKRLTRDVRSLLAQVAVVEETWTVPDEVFDPLRHDADRASADTARSSLLDACIEFRLESVVVARAMTDPVQLYEAPVCVDLTEKEKSAPSVFQGLPTRPDWA